MMRFQNDCVLNAARAMLAGGALLAGTALAQDPLQVSLTDATGLPGETVDVTLTFTGNGETSGFGGDFVIANPDVFSNVDLSACLAGNSSQVGTCVHPGGDPSRVRILLANDEFTPLADFSGTISFTIDPGADPELVTLAWDNQSWDTAAPPADVNGTDGSVEVLQEMGDPLAVSLSSESGNPGDPVSVTFTFTGNGETSGFGGDFVISNPGAFSDVDLSACLAGNTSQVGTCVHPGGDPSRVRILLANDEFTPLADFTGTIGFTIDGTATKGVVDLAWDDTAWDTAAPPADVNGTDGSVEILGLNPAQIDIDPPSFDLTLEAGASTTETLTIANLGDEALNWSIAGVPEGGCELPGWIVPNPAGGSVAGGASQDVSLSIDTEGLAPGNHAGEVCIDSNDPQTPQVVVPVALEVTAGDAQPGFDSNPPAPGINLGNTEPGGELSQNVVITNIGTEDLSVDCGPLNDPDGVFSIVPDPVVFPGILPGESETFTVSCQVPEPGSFSATMSCTTNDPDNATVDYQFTCQSAPLVIPAMNWLGMVLLILVLLAIAAWRMRATPEQP